MHKRLILIAMIVPLMACTCSLPFRLFTPPATEGPPPSPTPAGWTPSPEGIAGVEPPPAIREEEAPFTLAFADRAYFRHNLPTATEWAIQQLEGATVYHLALSFSDPPRMALGLEDVYYTNTEEVTLEEIDLALFPELLGGTLEIQEVRVDGQAVEAQQEGWLLRVPLRDGLEVGESLTLRIRFQVEIPSGGGDYYYGIFGYNDGTLSFAHAYPTVLVYNEEGWNNEKPDLDGDPLFSDASFYLVAVDAPEELALASSGIDVVRTTSGGRQRVLIANGPARDFYLAGSAEWIKQTRVIGAEMVVNSYSRPEDQEAASEALDIAREALETFTLRYGPYPYTEFDIAPITTSAGGVEYPGMTAIASDAFDWGYYLEVILVHEVAHMWFYNLVGNDTQDEPWLDESLAQFATWQYYLDCCGEAEAEVFTDVDLRLTWEMAADPETPIGLPVAAYPGDDYTAIIYGGGAFFLMALRDEMGVEAFDRFMEEYTTAYAWKIATSEDFKALAEEGCGCDLTPLFDEWVYP